MQVFLKIALMFIYFSMSTYASAGATCVQKNGLVACGKGKTNLITVNGLAVLKGTKAKSVQVNGSLRAHNATINVFTVNGLAELQQTKVTGAANINGMINAQNTTFQGLIRLISNNAKFENCHTKNIFVAKSKIKPQELHFSNSHIQGNIKFGGDGGEVYLCKGSVITGKVIGGKVIENC